MSMRVENQPTTVVVFGATGDLMARKILPALFYLYKEKKLPKRFRVIGVSRRELSEESFRTHAGEALGSFSAIARDKKLGQFLKSFSFVHGHFDELYTYEDLKRMLAPGAPVFFYLSVTPQFFAPILRNLARARAISTKSHVFVEKPIGLDLKSALKVEALLARYFNEGQIYRVDHYLAKDGLNDLFDFRFRARSMERIWSREHISKIELRLWEKNDVGYRGEFYDGVGTLRDVGQNHLLEMLSILVMPKPKTLTGQSIQQARALVLKDLKIPNRKSVKKLLWRAQYRGYLESKGVKRGSKTETFFRLIAFLRRNRFQGVPIMIEAGKAMPENRKEMVIYFKDGKNLTFPVEEHKIIYQYVEEYKKIFDCAFRGETSMFVSREEVLASWKFIDPIIKAFQKDWVPLKFYEPHKYPKI